MIIPEKHIDEYNREFKAFCKFKRLSCRREGKRIPNLAELRRMHDSFWKMFLNWEQTGQLPYEL